MYRTVLMRQRTPRVRRLLAYLIPVLALAESGPTAAQVIIPVQSRAATTVSARLNPTHPDWVTDTDSQEQAGSLNPLSSSASVVLSNGFGDAISVHGSNAVSWTSATSGTVTFQDVGWQAHMESGWTGEVAINSGGVRYDFLGPDAPARLSVSYATTLTGVNLGGANGFSIRPYRRVGSFLDYADGIHELKNASGTFEHEFSTLAPGLGYDGYGFEIEPTGTVSFGVSETNFEELMNGTFTFSVAPVPEPSLALLVAAVGVAGWVARRAVW